MRADEQANASVRHIENLVHLKDYDPAVEAVGNLARVFAPNDLYVRTAMRRLLGRLHKIGDPQTEQGDRVAQRKAMGEEILYLADVISARRGTDGAIATPLPILGANKVFVSYRREDVYAAGRISDRLVGDFGEDRVFFDLKSLDPGAKFGAHIYESIEQSAVVVAVIGPNWIGAKDGATARIHAPEDWVRREIEVALAMDVQIIPILVSGARSPVREDLPDSIHDLCGFTTVSFDVRQFHKQMDAVLATIKSHMSSGRDDEA